MGNLMCNGNRAQKKNPVCIKHTNNTLLHCGNKTGRWNHEICATIHYFMHYFHHVFHMRLLESQLTLFPFCLLSAPSSTSAV